MRKSSTYILLAIVLLTIVGCSRPNRIAQLSDDSLCNAVAWKDSAISLYRQVDSTAAMNEDEHVRYDLLRLLYACYSDTAPDNDSLVLSVADRTANRSSLLQGLSHICAAFTYESLGEENNALPHYVKAANILRNANKPELLCTVYSSWGWLLKTEPPYTEALVKLKQAEKYAVQAKDNKKLVYILGQQGWALLFQEDFKASSAMFDRAIALSLKNDSIRLGWLYKSKASACEMAGNHQEALDFTNRAITVTKGTDKSLIGIKGTCFTSLHQYDSARVYIERGRLDNHYYESATYHSEMATLEELQGNLQEALNHRRQYELYVDSQYEEDRRLALAQADKRYNYAVVLAERDRYELENQRKTALIIAFAAVLVAVGTIAVYTHQRYRRRTERALRMKEDLLTQIQTQLKERSLQLMQTQQETRDKEIELLSSLSSKEEQLAMLRSQQRELKESILHASDVIQKIEAVRDMSEKKKIKSAATIALSETEEQNLIDSTNLCYDNFVDRLRMRFVDISNDDICLCCLLKLGVSAQDQCLLLNTSDATLRTRKYRLKKKKMQLTDEFQTLDDFVHAF